ncbi:hypothetical protein D3C78_1818140 [compost metagenome]
MSADKMHKEFEAWWDDPAQAELRKSCSKGWAQYIWQASRAALCVELPDVRTEFSDRRAAIEACREAVEAAGITVKE